MIAPAFFLSDVEMGCLPQAVVELGIDLAAERQAHAIALALAVQRVEVILERVGVTAAHRVHVPEDGVQFPAPQGLDSDFSAAPERGTDSPTSTVPSDGVADSISPGRNGPAAPVPAGTSLAQPDYLCSAISVKAGDFAAPSWPDAGACPFYE